MNRDRLSLLAATLLLVPSTLAPAADQEPQGTAPGIVARRLPIRQPSDAKRFQRLDAARTGLDFVHRWSFTQRQLRQLDTGLIGGGVAVGDADADGLPDLYLTRPDGGARLYRNLGGFRFEDVTTRAGVERRAEWSLGASFADVDGDGDLDLFVCGYESPNRLYVNRGDGTFDERAREAGLAFTGASVMMAFADYDRDGDLDGYLLTNRLAPSTEQQQRIAEFRASCRPGTCVVPDDLSEFVDVLPRPDVAGLQIIDAGQLDRLYRNDGNGRFVDVTTQAGIAGAEFGLSATWWDHDGDSWPDLYVANDFHGADHLYHNNGDGTFTDVAPELLPHTPWFSMGSDTADVDGDGRVDLLATDMASTTHYKSKLTMGEMEENNWFLEYPEPRQYMRNALYLNTGAGRFQEAAFLAGVASTDWTWSVRFGDLDEDGAVDLFVSNGMTRYWFNSDLRREANEAEAAGRSSTEIWLASPKRTEANLAYRNLGDLRFEEVGSEWGLDHESVSFGAALADLDGDGDLDVVVSSFEELVGVWRNESYKPKRLVVRLSGRGGNTHGVGAILRLEAGGRTQARSVTLARGFASAGDASVHFGLGNSTTVDRLTVHWPSGRVQQIEGLAADHAYTLTEPAGAELAKSPPARPGPWFVRSDRLAGLRHVERPFDDFARQPLLPNRLSQLGPGLAFGDVNGDGADDLYLSGAAGQAGSLWLSRPDGPFERADGKVFAEDRESEDMAPLFFDVDSDGDVDLYVVSGGIECEPGSEILRDRLYLNDGAGRFEKAAGRLPDLLDSGSVAAAADVDRDGDLDLFVGSRSIPGAYPAIPDSRLLINDSGRFVERTDALAPGLRRAGLVTGALWSDVDDDGWIDLLVTRDWGPVGLWRNVGGRLEDQSVGAGLSARRGWFHGIAAGDVDNDGDVDYVVSNMGLNTKYAPAPGNPVRLYYGDFEGTGRRRIVEAVGKGEDLLPVRGLSCSSNAMPHIGEEFTSFREFAGSLLTDIYPPEDLQQALSFEVDTLDSAVLLNDGHGSFEFRPLPRRAQISPSYGVALTDVDADGKLDLHLAQNFFGPQPETGRMDGGVGLLLSGMGDGNFRPLGPDESGIVVPGDAKGLAIADVNGDGRHDLIIGVNDDDAVVFENRAPRHGRTLLLRLRGPDGRPEAVGARVTLELSGGDKRVAEVYAGGSWLSQSTSTLSFALGDGTEIERVVVRWPGGATSEIVVEGREDFDARDDHGQVRGSFDPAPSAQ